ncbi:transglutaminase TgpA family protein [Halomarina ordinaria]|uniref:DUF3488 and DUF4129 domain-containing transglutaminase family protein n=1 Tax=Halomarina ordinaria TaxID=3033939 RepID=A0ABD5UBI3_9EURY|nr:transglutaminase domain-containing protein [Halomarina sp. PSRA2]
MSTDARSSLGSRVPVAGTRAVSVAAMAVLTASYLSVLYGIVDVTGDPGTFALLVAGSLLAGVVLARYLPPLGAFALTAVIAVAGGLLYFPTVPNTYALADQVRFIWGDVLALVTGLSILRIINAELWALAVAPVPVFLSWYLTARRRYALAAGVSGAPLVFFVLTGDASLLTALVGVVAAAVVLGVGDLDRRDGRLADADGVVLVVAAMVVLTVSASVVPTGSGQPLLSTDGPQAETVEGSLVNDDGQFAVQGAIDLSPEVRFRVESDRGDYWRIDAYDRYTGDGWIRTAESQPYRDGLLDPPPGESQRVRQRVTAEDDLNVMPAAWKPVAMSGHSTRATDFGGLEPAEPLAPGDDYTVVSQTPTPRPGQLRDAGTSYPDGVTERYTQLPDSTPDRVGTFTERLTANADNPYDTARVVETYLEDEKEYSLDVRKPSGDIADQFLFEMEAGYCTYYATTMVTMLRSQDVPARMVTGYTEGERVDDDEWVVRGLDAHAWVEVYFPGQGWVAFDPTPSGPRESTEQGRLDDARANGTEDVDTNETRPDPPENDSEPDPDNGTAANETNETAPNGTDGNESTNESAGGQSGSGVAGPDGLGSDGGGSDTDTGDGDGGGDEGAGFQLTPPTPEQAALGLALAVGLVAGVRRTGLDGRAYRAFWLRRQSATDDPEADVRRAFDRLEYLLERTGRARAPGETPRQYLGTMPDERARRVGELYERAVYAGRSDRALADEAIALVDDLVDDRTRL